MKNFKNEFGVRGSVALIKAFKSEVESLGWKYDEDFTKWSDLPKRGETPLLYFCVDDVSTMKRNHFSLSSSSSAILNLPNDWSKAIQLASEIEEEIPEYVKCLDIDRVNGHSRAYYSIPGRIYKYNGMSGPHYSLECNLQCAEYGPGSTLYEWGDFFILATKAEYDAQQEEFRKKELLEEAVRKYPVGTKFKDLTCMNFAANNALEVKGELYWNKEGITGFEFGYVYYHDQWAEIVEDEFKAGDYVLLAGTSTFSGNGIGIKEAIVKLLPLGTLSNPTGNFSPDFEFIWDNSNLGTKKEHIIRKATPSEIEKYKAENEIEIGGYKAEFKDGKVSFGCKKDITKEDLLAIRKV